MAMNHIKTSVQVSVHFFNLQTTLSCLTLCDRLCADATAGASDSLHKLVLSSQWTGVHGWAQKVRQVGGYAKQDN